MSEHENIAEAPKVYGLIAEFDEADDLLAAASKTYRAGYRAIEAYTPFPLHGLSEAIGFDKTHVPVFTLLGGILGAIFGFGMQYFAMVMHSPYHVGGKPLNSWPAFIPITFEMTILFAAFAALGSMLLLNGLPRYHHPIFNAKRFERASSDGFFLCIESGDGKFDARETRAFLEGLDPVDVSEVLDT